MKWIGYTSNLIYGRGSKMDEFYRAESIGWAISPQLTCTQSTQCKGKLRTSDLLTKKHTEQENFFPSALYFMQTMKE